MSIAVLNGLRDCALRRRVRQLFIALGAILLFQAAADAADKSPAQEKPKGPTILTVEYRSSSTGVVSTADFSLEMLLSLEQHVVSTTTQWTDGKQRFEGPLVRDVLSAAGVKGEKIIARALNDYQIEVPWADIVNYPVVVALKHNGSRMSVRQKGPLWIVYPQDDHPQLKSELIYPRWVWQLRRLTVQ
jgi:hypothetical protein